MRGVFLKKYRKKTTCLLLCAAVCLLLWACKAAPPVETVPETTVPVVKSFASPDFPEELKQYLGPWDQDASAMAVEDGRLHYYFMSSRGMLATPEATAPSKWGDACLVVFPDGRTMLVDSGSDAYSPVLVENLKRLGIQKLDYVFFSHEHFDHVGGALTEGGVFDSFPVGRVYWSGITYPNNHDVRQFCADRGIPLKTVRRGDALRFGDVRLEVLWPEIFATKDSAATVTAQNNYSLVFRLEYQTHSALFPGDLYARGEEKLMYVAGNKLDVDLVKICHHGHDSSSSTAFVQALSAKLAVATGAVPIAPVVQQAYDSTGTKVLSDLEHGYIHITSDGTDLVQEPV